jgi:hypothetical protein
MCFIDLKNIKKRKICLLLLGCGGRYAKYIVETLCWLSIGRRKHLKNPTNLISNKKICSVIICLRVNNISEFSSTEREGKETRKSLSRGSTDETEIFVAYLCICCFMEIIKSMGWKKCSRSNFFVWLWLFMVVLVVLRWDKDDGM